MKKRGTNLTPKNSFEHLSYESLEENSWHENISSSERSTEYISTHPKTIVNKVSSPDVGMSYSLNPYQGCEHGCIYCYARNSHEYWGYNAGLDFESKILVKYNAPKLFKTFINHPKWDNSPIGISGNTDCYQPIEKKLKLTQQILNIANSHNQCVGIITKNSLILRDIEILKKMAKKGIICVYISITGVDETIRLKLEPRTASYKKRFDTLRILADNDIPCGVMAAPIIPGINDNQLGKILQLASKYNVPYAGYTVIRLQHQLEHLFTDWLEKHFPDRAKKVINMIKKLHGGKVQDSRFSTRMKGEGIFSEMISKQFKIFTQKFNLNKKKFEYNRTSFVKHHQQLKLFP